MTTKPHELNPAQYEAVMHNEGPIVVFAGAGSGKTRVITTRIARLISEGVPPHQILAVTFTNKAAAEMKERVRHIQPAGHGCLIATFHAACARWLREFASELDFTPDFTIYDDTDSKNAIKAVVKSLNADVDLESLIPDYKYFIHVAKTHALAPQATEDLARVFGQNMPTAAIEVYKRYQEFLHQCNAMDFGDLLMNMLLLLRRHQTVRQIIQQRYRFVLIDEYQDTNQTQLELIKHIVSGHENLMVVGDDDQSIYSWRGATPYNILDFEKTYPNAKRVLLEDNYRSTAHIVEAAAQVIKNNTQRARKTLRTTNPPGELIDFFIESDGDMEAWSIVHNIKDERDRYPYDTVAIFYRTNAQSRLLEDALRVENIPYQIFGSVKFYDRLEVKDILAYLRLLANPNDDISFARIINTPIRGIGSKAVDTVQEYADQWKTSLLVAARRIVQEGIPKISKKIAPFVLLFDHLEKTFCKVDLDELIDLIVDATGYFEYLKKKFPDQYHDKMENVHELTSAISDFIELNPEAQLHDWLQSITLVRDDSNGDSEEQTGVSLMTLHMAKGLEYDRVYIVGCEENILPHANSLDDPMLCEEERRLFYVGMTRARQKLSLYSAYYRRIYNKPQKNNPSRFISEIPRQYISNTTARASMDYLVKDDYSGTTYDYSDGVALPLNRMQLNQAVYHLTYGRGHIIELPGWPDQGKVVVDFEEFGRRKVSTSQLSQI